MIRGAKPSGGAARCNNQSDDHGTDTAALVAGALRGEQVAWDGLVSRYLPLVVAVTRAYRLSEKDAEDVAQLVWLRLLQHLPRIREPLAVPKWIAVTTRNECRHVARTMGSTVLVDPALDDRLDRPGEPEPVDAALLRAEAHQAIRDGMAQLRPAQRDLLTLLAAEPPLPYREIAGRLGLAVGSIGPMRARALDQLRATPAMRGFLEATAGVPDGVSVPRR
ncbi:MAG: sigma-70 family RNA polymerase sigma factor [Actinoplanes sp.]